VSWLPFIRNPIEFKPPFVRVQFCTVTYEPSMSTSPL
jgi:hypothetical protein